MHHELIFVFYCLQNNVSKKLYYGFYGTVDINDGFISSDPRIMKEHDKHPNIFSKYIIEQSTDFQLVYKKYQEKLDEIYSFAPSKRGKQYYNNKWMDRPYIVLNKIPNKKLSWIPIKYQKEIENTKIIPKTPDKKKIKENNLGESVSNTIWIHNKNTGERRRIVRDFFSYYKSMGWAAGQN